MLIIIDPDIYSTGEPSEVKLYKQSEKVTEGDGVNSWRGDGNQE